jgi:hypothetical protein
MYGCLTRTLDRRLSNTTVNRPASFDLDLFDINKKNVGEGDATLSHPPLSYILHPLHTLRKFAMVYIYIFSSSSRSIISRHENDQHGSKPAYRPHQYLHNIAFLLESGFTYADVAAKTSTLLALVITARQNANMPVNATAIANRSRVLATK